VTTPAKTIVGEICLYGGHFASDYLAVVAPDAGVPFTPRPDGGASLEMFGDGEPREGRSLNDSVWLACLEFCDRGHKTGLVKVYAPDGRHVALTRVDRPCYYGALDWQAAELLTVSLEDLTAVAE